MRAATIIVTAAVVLASIPVAADDRQELAAELMKTQRAQESVEFGIGQMEKAMRAQLDQESLPKGKPTCTQDALVNVVKSELSWKTLEPKIRDIYAEEFTEQELRELVAFFQSPLGRTYLDKLPRVMERTQQVNAEVSRAAFEKLRSALEGCRGGGH